MTHRRHILASVLLPLALSATIAAQSEQPPLGAPPPGQAQDVGLAPREIQQMIDAYVLMQAQNTLALTDDQFPQFVTRLKALQDTRRRHQQGRMRIVQDLNRLSAPRNPRTDDAAIKDQLKALQDLDARSLAEIQKAVEHLDQLLTPRQQARLRVFEEQMERRKIDLLVRARQGARGRARGPGL